jgi:hypothetical protein
MKKLSAGVTVRNVFASAGLTYFFLDPEIDSRYSPQHQSPSQVMWSCGDP